MLDFIKMGWFIVCWQNWLFILTFKTMIYCNWWSEPQHCLTNENSQLLRTCVINGVLGFLLYIGSGQSTMKNSLVHMFFFCLKNIVHFVSVLFIYFYIKVFMWWVNLNCVKVIITTFKLKETDNWDAIQKKLSPAWIIFQTVTCLYGGNKGCIINAFCVNINYIPELQSVLVCTEVHWIISLSENSWLCMLFLRALGILKVWQYHWDNISVEVLFVFKVLVQ